MDQNDLSLDLLMQETLALSEYLRFTTPTDSGSDDVDYLFDLADSVTLDDSSLIVEQFSQEVPVLPIYPDSPGVIYKIDSGMSTFCVRGYSVTNIRAAFLELEDRSSTKRIILKMAPEDSLQTALFFETKTFELAEAIREQIINRRFPHQEDAVCNISDPGFSWWMNICEGDGESERQGRFELFFRSHGINRAEKYIQLGPIGDGGVAALRMNQARTLLRSSFPISEFSCDDKSFTVATQKPDHLGFQSFKRIFLEGVNQTELENFPDNSLGRTLFYYFHELAIVRKFWIEVKRKLG